MTQDDEPDRSSSDDDLHDCGVRLLLAMLASADTDVIAPKDWWRRGQAALKAGAGMSASFAQMVSKMADKLQIEAPRKASAREVSKISSEIDGDFDRFRAICERDAFMITADAQVVRDMEKEERDAEFDDAFNEQGDFDPFNQKETT